MEVLKVAADWAQTIMAIIVAAIAAYAVPYLVTRGIIDGAKSAGEIRPERRKADERKERK